MAGLVPATSIILLRAKKSGSPGLTRRRRRQSMIQFVMIQFVEIRALAAAIRESNVAGRITLAEKCSKPNDFT